MNSPFPVSIVAVRSVQEGVRDDRLYSSHRLFGQVLGRLGPNLRGRKLLRCKEKDRREDARKVCEICREVCCFGKEVGEQEDFRRKSSVEAGGTPLTFERQVVMD
jgi:hypothetical protein